MLFPTKAVVINRSGFSTCTLSILPIQGRFLEINSKRNLFEETKAVSIPEKKADKANAIVM